LKADFEEEAIDKRVEFAVRRQPMANGQPRKLSPFGRRVAVNPAMPPALTGCGLCDSVAHCMGCCQGEPQHAGVGFSELQPKGGEWRPGSASEDGYAPNRERSRIETVAFDSNRHLHPGSASEDGYAPNRERPRIETVAFDSNRHLHPGGAVEWRLNTRSLPISPDRSPGNLTRSPSSLYGTAHGTGYPNSLPCGSSAGFPTSSRSYETALPPEPPPPPPRPGFSSPVQHRNRRSPPFG